MGNLLTPTQMIATIRVMAKMEWRDLTDHDRRVYNEAGLNAQIADLSSSEVSEISKATGVDLCRLTHEGAQAIIGGEGLQIEFLLPANGGEETHICIAIDAYAM